MALSVALAVGSKVLSGALSSSSNRRRRRAARLRNDITQIQNFQARRAFLNKFFEAQGMALNQGAQTGAGLGSSGVQGTAASHRTQVNTGLREQEILGGLAQSAFANDQKAAKTAELGNIASAAGDLFSVPEVANFINKI